MRSCASAGARVRAALVAAGCTLALGAAGCADLASTRDVRVTILDEHSQPIPGAVFYVEAEKDGRAYAYLWRVAGLAGEVPDSAREPLKLPWRRGARLAMVAFAKGRTPAVVREAQGRVISDGAVLVLSEGLGWNEELLELAFPFEDEPDLAARLADPGEEPLRAAFTRAWNERPAEAVSPQAGRKEAALRELAQGSGRSGRS